MSNGISIETDGKVALSDDKLKELESFFVSAGGASPPTNANACSGINLSCMNTGECGNTTNRGSCTNTYSCSGGNTRCQTF